MAVLAEGISVIIRKNSVEQKYPGGLVAFNAVPKFATCADDEIIRVGFMDPQDAEAFIINLEIHGGLQFMSNGKSMDMAVADQQKGLIVAECDWLEFGRLQLGEDKVVSVCWFFDGPRQFGHGTYMYDTEMEIATPQGWEYEGSLSDKFRYAAKGAERDHLKFLRSENNMDVYLDLETGKEFFVGRNKEK